MDQDTIQILFQSAATILVSVGGAYLTIKVTIAEMRRDIEHIERDIEEIKEDRAAISKHMTETHGFIQEIKNDLQWIKEKI